VTEPPRPLSPTEIVEEIGRTRARMARTLSVLDREYALRHLAVRAIRLARHPENGARAVREALRRDALPLGFIGIGLGWLSFAGNNAGKDLLGRLATALAALQRVAADLGLLAPPPPLAGPPLTPPPPDPADQSRP
jgi:hypothetical protein